MTIKFDKDGDPFGDAFFTAVDTAWRGKKTTKAQNIGLDAAKHDMYYQLATKQDVTDAVARINVMLDVVPDATPAPNRQRVARIQVTPAKSGVDFEPIETTWCAPPGTVQTKK
jgi:hypothetical protein